MKLIVGLGNPGGKYKRTRHNIGFRVIEHLAKNHKIKLNIKKYHSFIGKGTLSAEGVSLFLPQTFMNLSGSSVAKFMQRNKLNVDDLLIVCDDVNLPFGALRLRRKGSAGGHNGLESIIDNIESQNFARLRVGIGKFGEDMAEFVLGKFSKEEEKSLTNIVERAKNACVLWALEGADAAMKKFNVKGEVVG